MRQKCLQLIMMGIEFTGPNIHKIIIYPEPLALPLKCHLTWVFYASLLPSLPSLSSPSSCFPSPLTSSMASFLVSSPSPSS